MLEELNEKGIVLSILYADSDSSLSNGMVSESVRNCGGGSNLDEFEYHHGFGQFGNRGDEVSSFFARKKKNV